MVKDVEEALKLEVPYLPNFKQMQEKLLDAFPIDIFKNKIILWKQQKSHI